MNKVYIIKSTRKSLIKYLYNYFKKNFDTKVINIKTINNIFLYENEIKNNLVEFIVFSNGTDPLDIDLHQKILNMNPSQKFYFSENGWLTYQDYIYLDRKGIGNNSELYSFTHNDIGNYNIQNDKITEATRLTNERLFNFKSEEYEYRNYILVPLQVDGDSKLKIGSPYFAKVKDFVDYIINTTPKDIQILFKNHPHNKKRVKIPKLDNVVDISDKLLSKAKLIKNSLFVGGINSTFLIESMFLEHKTVTWGLDVFSNKNIIIEGYGKNFEEILTDKNINKNIQNKFMHILMSRQVPKNENSTSSSAK